jgi:hypothetical protein
MEKFCSDIGRAALEACSTTWDLDTNSAFALRRRKTTAYLPFTMNRVSDLHRSHRKHQGPTVVLLLRAHSLPRESVYRTVAYKRPSILAELLRISGVKRGHRNTQTAGWSYKSPFICLKNKDSSPERVAGTAVRKLTNLNQLKRVLYITF